MFVADRIHQRFFFLMMNSRRILGDEMPTGGRSLGMEIRDGAASVIGALIAAGTSISGKAIDPNERVESFARSMTPAQSFIRSPSSPDSGTHGPSSACGVMG